jgi:excisionase family DNA binding protein
MTAAKTLQVTRLLSIRQVAVHLAVSEKTISRLIKDQRIPIHRIRGQVRISEADLAAYLVESRVYPGANSM